ncbi:MAG: MBL fold metallo-hydrolase [Spirochaetaceae bacterium]|jgi:glyoxylase-like metal-dependent hydrolase (beta-lactamase superfamily II)|nr:MBL fold metallo-hydrolase [Spirochaetaceae bacterium]
MFELIRAGENTFFIDAPAKVGIYRLSGGSIILIDSGNSREAGRKILNILGENNWTLDVIINTHSNADHMGGNAFLAGKTGCKIYACGIEKAFCAYPVLEPAFLFGGFPVRELRHKFLLAEPCPAEDSADFIPPPDMELFPLKGHYFDMIGVKTPDDVYFLGDSVSGEAVLAKYHISFIYDVAEYLKTLDAIEHINGKLFVPAHADTARTMGPLVRINRQKVLEIVEHIKCLCKKPAPFEEILKGLFDIYGLKMDITQYALAGSTVKSYLSYLSGSGIVAMETKNNYLLWKLR